MSEYETATIVNPTSHATCCSVFAVRQLIMLLCCCVQAVWAGFDGDKPSCDLNGSTPEINACAIQDFENADRTLNSEYTRLRRSLTASEQTKLQKEQRVWLKSRDVECEALLKGDEGGSIWTSEFYTCIAEATRNRVDSLRTWPVH